MWELLGMPDNQVQVYKNLHKNRWSVRQHGRVIAHCHEVVLAGVKFHVSQKGRNRVVANQCREVHAWATGYLTTLDRITGVGTELCYDPYRAATFTTREGKPVTEASFVHFTAQNQAFAY